MMNSEQAAIGVAITRTRYDAEADCVVVEEVDPLDWYAEDVRPAAVHIAASELYKTRIDAINAQVNAMLARGPLAVIDKIDPVKLEQHKRLVAEKRRVGRVDVTVLDEAAEISQQAWDKLEMMRGVIDRDAVRKAQIALEQERIARENRVRVNPPVFELPPGATSGPYTKELVTALAPPETEKPRKLHEEYTLDDWRRGIANSSRQYHGS
jgi:hypothetical protein